MARLLDMLKVGTQTASKSVSKQQETMIAQESSRAEVTGDKRSLTEKWETLGKPKIPIRLEVTILDLQKWLQVEQSIEDMSKVREFLDNAGNPRGRAEAVHEELSQWQPIIDPITGWVLNPALPCVKGDGFCRLRRELGVRFQCIFHPQDCEFKRQRLAQGG